MLLRIRFSTQTLDVNFWSGWLLLVPLLLYIADPKLGFFTPTHYGWWYIFGVSIFLGVALAKSPNIIFPEGAPHETSRWQPGQIYVEERDLQVPYPYSRTGLALYMIVYWFDDNKRQIPPGANVDGNLFLKRLEVVAW